MTNKRKIITILITILAITLLCCITGSLLLWPSIKTNLQKQGLIYDNLPKNYCSQSKNKLTIETVPLDDNVIVRYTNTDQHCYFKRQESSSRDNRIVINELRNNKQVSTLSLINLYDYTVENWNNGIIRACERNEPEMQTQSGKNCLYEKISPAQIPLTTIALQQKIQSNKVILVRNYASNGNSAYYFTTDQNIFTLFVYQDPILGEITLDYQ